jgi:hypothetical protein
MRVLSVGLAAILLMAVQAAEAAPRSITPAELIAAGKRATISEIDYQRADCNDNRTLEAWLKQVVGETAKSVRWGGGKCVLAVKENPRDGGTKYCAHAVIVPKQGKHTATIETYFDPKDGKLGKAFAFRAHVYTKDGPDYARETSAFEFNWGETYVPGFTAPQRDNACD